MEPSASDPYVGALLGLACGDALGAPAEFLNKAELEARCLCDGLGVGSQLTSLAAEKETLP